MSLKIASLVVAAMALSMSAHAADKTEIGKSPLVVGAFNQQGTAAQGIVGTGIEGIVGTGVHSNGIVGTGVHSNGIVGTGIR